MRVKKKHTFIRIIVRRGHVWVSELLGIFIVLTILVSLAILVSKVFVLEFTIKKNSAHLSETRTERVNLTHELKEMRKKQNIAMVLDNFTRGKLQPPILWTLVDLVYQNSTTFGYDPFLVLAVIHVESLFDPNARGQYRSGAFSGALGLMQLKYETAQEVAKALGMPFREKEELFVPEINIILGVSYLTQQISYFKSLKLGILAYNQGPGTILDNLKRNQPLSINYYNKVLKSYYELKRMSLHTVR